MPNRLDRIRVADLDAFQGLSADQLEDVLRPARIRSYAKNALVFEEGAPADTVFVLIDGRLKLHQSTLEGQQVILRLVNRGDIFGFAAAIGERNYFSTAIAVAESAAFAWDQAYWQELLTRCPGIASNLVKTVGRWLLEQQARVRELATQRAEQRIAGILLRVIKAAGNGVDGGIEVAFPISRQDLAEMTGTTLFTVSRVISAWDRCGVTGSGRQHITVRDPEALRLIAEEGRAAV